LPNQQLAFGSFAARQKSAQPAIDACNTAIFHHPHLSFSGCFKLRTDQFNTVFQQPFAKRITVVPFIGYDADRIFPRPTTTFSRHSNLLNGGFQPFYFTWPGRIEISTDKDSLAIDHHHPLCPLSAFGFSNAWAPFLPRQNYQQQMFLPNLTGPVGPALKGT
jgi:hypothetical protein